MTNIFIGKQSGMGKMFYTNGHVYQGQWEKGKINGYGVYINCKCDTNVCSTENPFENCSKIKGSWKDGNAHGLAYQILESGATYRGNFENRVKKGHGEFKWPSGTIFTGDSTRGKHYHS